ncbi:MAG: hypothetical protein AAF447_01480 [Myxococcota bacterium]
MRCRLPPSPRRGHLALVLGLLVVTSACADREPPTWPSAGELQAAREGDAVTLRWAAATDDKGLARYELSTNGAFPTSLDASASSHRLAGLATGQVLRFELVALDDAGNRSEALLASVAVPEAPAPPGQRRPAPGSAANDDALAPDAPRPDEARAPDRPGDRAVQALVPAQRILPQPGSIPELPALPRREALGGPITLRPGTPGAQLQLPPHLQQPQLVRPTESPPER